MKTIVFLSLLLAFIPVFSQDREMIFIAGMVTDIDTEEPVEGQEVIATTNDSLIYIKMITNEEGFFRDTAEVLVTPVSYLYFYTLDCLGQVHDTIVSLFGGIQIFVNFKICTNSQVNTYDLGGFLFAGDYPINNPESTGDTAKTVLYRIVQDKIFPVDTLIFHDLGYYWFAAVPKGLYMVKSWLLPSSYHFHEYAPTYTGNEMVWQSVNPIALDRDLYNTDIELIDLHEVAPGPGSIHGTISFETLFHDEKTSSSENIEILLMDQNNQPLSTYFTDQKGLFIFSNLAFGTYKILADATGMFTQPVEVTITEISPNGDASLSLYENNIFGIVSDEPENRSVSILMVYPNPAVNDLQVHLQVNDNDHFFIQLINSQGYPISQNQYQLVPGKHIIRYPFAELPCGLYLILVKDNTGKLIDSEKVVK